jgi:hypothetical protein
MPTGTPIFLKVGPGGILFPYYEGHFKGVSGGSTSAIEIEVRTRKAGEVFAPEYYPDYVTFKTPKSVIELPGGGGALARPGAPIAQLWAETPDTTNPPAGVLNRNRLLIGISGPRNGKLLLDSIGASDYVQTITTEQLAVSYGSQPIFFNGTAATPNWQPVNHGLGRIPKVIMMPISFQDNGWIVPVVNLQPFAPGPPNATQFFFAARDLLSSAHGPGTIPCPWMAIG